MEITEIRIKLMEGSEDRLRAFCSITIDHAFVVRDLKIIDGTNGPFLAMPSRKLTGHCARCGHKNHLRASYCNHCGVKIVMQSGAVESPQKLYADVAHPINSECREMIQHAVIDEFSAELARSRQPGYRSRYDDEFDAGDYDEADYSSGDPAPQVRVSAAESLPRAPQMSGRGEASRSDNGSAGAAPADLESESNSATDSPSDELSDFGAGLSDRPSRVVREERRDQQSVPRPHFQDRPGGSRGSHVATSPRGGKGGAADSPPTDDETSEDGFGAGIFDS